MLSRETILNLINRTPPLIDNIKDIDTQLQPNGFDLTVKTIGRPYSPGTIDFDNKKRQLPYYEYYDFGDLLPAGHYVVTFNEIFNIPKNIAAITLPRSSLFRMGTSLQAGVYDAGYSGTGQALLIVGPGQLMILKDARIAQMIFFELDKETIPYSGIYQNSPG